jgi:hypothetical protein
MKSTRSKPVLIAVRGVTTTAAVAPTTAAAATTTTTTEMNRNNDMLRVSQSRESVLSQSLGAYGGQPLLLQRYEIARFDTLLLPFSIKRLFRLSLYCAVIFNPLFCRHIASWAMLFSSSSSSSSSDDSIRDNI